MARPLGAKDRKKRKRKSTVGLLASSGVALAGNTLFNAGIIYRTLNRSNPHARAFAMKVAAFNPRTHLMVGGLTALNLLSLKSLPEGKKKDAAINNSTKYNIGGGLATGLIGLGLVSRKLK